MTNGNNINEDKILNKLILMSQINPEKPFQRPDEETISAYLLDNATESQKNLIHKAVLKSKSFRKEILDMIDDLDELKKNEIQTENSSQSLNELPDYQNFLSKFEHKSEEEISKTEESFWYKIIDITKLKSIQVSAVAAAAIIILTIIPFDKFNDPQITYGKWNMIDESVKKELLIFNLTRSTTNAISENNFKTAKEAAISEFKDLLEFNFNNSEFIIKTTTEEIASDENIHKMTLALLDDSNNKIAEYKRNIPQSINLKSDSIYAWILLLPSRKLYNFKMINKNSTLLLPNTNDHKGCIAFTFYQDSTFKVIIGTTFKK